MALVHAITVIGILLVVLISTGCASPAHAMQTQQLQTVEGILQLYGAFAGVAALGAGWDAGH